MKLLGYTTICYSVSDKLMDRICMKVNEELAQDLDDNMFNEIYFTGLQCEEVIIKGVENRLKI